jgi:hypothetical protein
VEGNATRAAITAFQKRYTPNPAEGLAGIASRK